MTEPRDARVGTRIAGRYVVRALVDRGGMGRVYRADQEPLGRSVAVKLLDLRDPDGEFLRRFEREAVIQARLSHPHTVRVFDSGRTEDGTPFLVMELLAGRSLKDVLAEEAPLPPLRVIRLLRQICGALQEAHEQGLVHRDLKPANVFLTRHGDDPDFVKVLDFGLAKDLAHDPGLSHTGQALGSPLYMAPEQVEGRPVDARTDIYALGLLAYAALSGEVPFKRGSVATVMLQQVSGRAPTFAELGRGLSVPAGLEALVRACMEKDPARRPASMREVALRLDALERELSAGPEALPAPPSRLPSALALALGASALAAGAGLAALGVAVAGLGWWSAPRPPVEAPVSVPAARAPGRTVPLSGCETIVLEAPLRGQMSVGVTAEGEPGLALRGARDRVERAEVEERDDGVVRVAIEAEEPGLQLEVDIRCPGLRTLDAGRASVELGPVEGESLRITSESGDVRLAGARVGRLTVVVTESADVALGEVELGRLEIELRGSGDVSGRGRADALVLVQRGSGDAELAELVVRDAEATTQGSGDAELHVTERLIARGERSGDIRWTGAPRALDAQALGSGRVEPR